MNSKKFLEAVLVLSREVLFLSKVRCQVLTKSNPQGAQTGSPEHQLIHLKRVEASCLCMHTQGSGQRRIVQLGSYLPSQADFLLVLDNAYIQQARQTATGELLDNFKTCFLLMLPSIEMEIRMAGEKWGNSHRLKRFLGSKDQFEISQNCLSGTSQLSLFFQQCFMLAHVVTLLYMFVQRHKIIPIGSAHMCQDGTGGQAIILRTSSPPCALVDFGTVLPRMELYKLNTHSYSDKVFKALSTQ